MSTQSLPRSHVSEILSRIVGPEEGNLTPQAARAILKLKLLRVRRVMHAGLRVS